VRVKEEFWVNGTDVAPPVAGSVVIVLTSEPPGVVPLIVAVLSTLPASTSA